ncbi:MAG: hypothetical protein HYV36_02160 [Lentisphaerae bacterium]|nr:hypothetical protein [Lentisphaerota bacterium]
MTRPVASRIVASMRLKKYSLYILFPGCILVGLGLGVKWAAASAQPSVASAKGADPSSGKASTIAKAAMEDKMEDKPEKAATTPLSAASSEKNGENAIAVAPPPFSEGIFPCSACHDEKESVNTTPRPLSFHDDIVLKHDEKERPAD